MTVAYGKGAKGKATRLHSQYVRQRDGRCVMCGTVDGLQCAHIISRRYSATRTHPLNGWALCASCHSTVDLWADVKMELVERTIGLETYEILKSLTVRPFKTPPGYWEDQAATLSELIQLLPE